MYKMLRIGAIAVAMVATTGCAVKGGWMGTDAERTYEQQLAAARLDEQLVHDRYWEIHRDGRIQVIADAEDYELFRQTGEIPLVVTRIGGGPNGETLRFGLTRKEAKTMAKIVGYKGSAQRLYEGDVEGDANDFYGEIHRDGRIYVFNDWADLQAYKQTHEAAYAVTRIGAGPERETVVFVLNKSSASTVPAQTIGNFKTIYALN
ncbi:MAG: hypothetical protein PHP86_00635 [Nevskiales bacterium]|nr:hypothetical protein [Nevskiales bacterium]